MRFFHSLTLAAFILTYLLSDNVLGASLKGKYMWLRCNPVNKNANCIERKGPSLDLSAKAPHISSANEIEHIESSEESAETEESGDGSGDLFNSILPESRKVRDSGAENEILIEPEGSGLELNSDNYVYPFSRESKLSAKDLLEDNFIE